MTLNPPEGMVELQLSLPGISYAGCMDSLETPFIGSLASIVLVQHHVSCLEINARLEFVRSMTCHDCETLQDARAKIGLVALRSARVYLIYPEISRGRLRKRVAWSPKKLRFFAKRARPWAPSRCHSICIGFTYQKQSLYKAQLLHCK